MESHNPAESQATNQMVSKPSQSGLGKVMVATRSVMSTSSSTSPLCDQIMLES